MNLQIATARFKNDVVIADADGGCYMGEVTEGEDCKSMFTMNGLLCITYEDQAPTYVPLFNVIQMDAQVRK